MWDREREELHKDSITQSLATVPVRYGADISDGKSTAKNKVPKRLNCDSVEKYSK